MATIEIGASSWRIEGLPSPMRADEQGRGEGVANFCCKPLKKLDSEKEMKGNERKFAVRMALEARSVRFAEP